MELVNRPMGFVRKKMAEHDYEPSYVSEIYEKSGGEISQQQEQDLKWSAASLYAGGADTVSPCRVLYTLVGLLTCRDNSPSVPWPRSSGP